MKTFFWVMFSIDAKRGFSISSPSIPPTFLCQRVPTVFITWTVDVRHSRRHVVAVELNEKLKVLRWNLEFRQGSVRCGCGCCGCNGCCVSCSCCSCLGLGLCCLWCFWCLCLVVCLFVCLLDCLFVFVCFVCVLFVFCLCFVLLFVRKGLFSLNVCVLYTARLVRRLGSELDSTSVTAPKFVFRLCGRRQKPCGAH
jgi:hypothetical protein